MIKKLRGKIIFQSPRETEIVSLQSNTRRLILGCHLVSPATENSILDRFKLVTLEFQNVHFVQLPTIFFLTDIFEQPVEILEQSMRKNKDSDYKFSPIFEDIFENPKNSVYYFRAENITYGWAVAERYTFHVIQQSKRSQKKPTGARRRYKEKHHG
jgi:hypothetical protein